MLWRQVRKGTTYFVYSVFVRFRDKHMGIYIQKKYMLDLFLNFVNISQTPQRLKNQPYTFFYIYSI